MAISRFSFMTRLRQHAKPRRFLAGGLTALLVAGTCAVAADRPQPRLVPQGLAGYISMEVPPPPQTYQYGVSLYATAWPLVERPLHDFQVGLASIWIVPENRQINY